MKMTRLATCVALLLAGAGAGAGAATPAPAAVRLPGPAFPAPADAAAVQAACDAGLQGSQQRIAALERVKPGAAWLRAWDGLNNWNEDASGALTFLQNVHPDKAVREAASACELRWADLGSSLGQNEKVYAGGAKTRTLLKDPVDLRAVQVALEGFEDSGVGLPADKRAEAKAISDKLTALSQTFSKNIRDAGTKVAFTDDELAGVPDAVWKDAPRDAEGRRLLGVDNPSFLPVLQAARSAAARERMWQAKTNEGGEANLKILAEITQLRRSYARLFGADSYADFVLRRRMALDTAHTSKFLGEVGAAVAERERTDIAQLRAAKAADLKLPLEQVKLERWDAPYYAEQVKRAQYTLDTETFRPYFPPEASLKVTMRIAEQLFGIRYVRVPGTYWHPEVQAYAVQDAKTGKPLASLYIDLYPRDGKYNHAAVWSYRNASTAAHREPQAALVVNFNRQGLTLDEFTTLLHEFGHSIHATLSATRWSSDGGTNVQLDFVEAPSQMLEDWAYDPKVLALFQQVCSSCKPVPADLLERARQAREFQKGAQTARQHLYASYDLALHTAEAPDPMATWARMEGATPLGYVPGSKFPAGFAHVAGGYGSGYYAYLWSKVVAVDLRTAFAADKLDPVVGARYRAKVLSQGGQKLPADLVKDFLGRETNAKAFYEDLKR